MQRVFNFEGKNRSEVVIREVLLGREIDTREGNNGVMDEYRVNANPSMEPEARVAIIGTDKVQRRVISKKKKKKRNIRDPRSSHRFSVDKSRDAVALSMHGTQG